jgi:hypothetical protein
VCAYLLYGVDVLRLSRQLIHRLSVTYNTAVRKCFGLSRYTSVRNVIYFMNCLPFDLISNQRRILMLRDCLAGVGLLHICALLACNDDGFINMCHELNMHCGMSVSGIKREVWSKWEGDSSNQGVFVMLKLGLLTLIFFILS